MNFHLLFVSLLYVSFWIFLAFSLVTKLTTFNFAHSILKKLWFIVSCTGRGLHFLNIIVLFTFVGAGVVSEAIQVAFPVAASVPSLLQTHQSSKNNQERSRGNENHAIQLVIVDILKADNLKYILIMFSSVGYLFGNWRRVPAVL